MIGHTSPPLSKALVRTFLVLLILAGLAIHAMAQTGKTYRDYRKKSVYLPAGDISFADRVVAQKQGRKKPPKAERRAANALGPPDYRKSGDGRAFTLGCRGEAVFEFVDNALIDIEGIDFYVFEVGADVEPTNIALSKDGKRWTSIGRIAGGQTGIDLADYDLAGQDFRFVRVTDLGKFCSGRWPGADIDAIAAVGSALRFSLSGKVLFDFDKSNLKPAASTVLDDLIVRLDKIKVAKITVVGHTDSRGSDAYNKRLSDRRASSVVRYFRAKRPGLLERLESVGRGETEPVDDNRTDSGRAKNRRVEVIIVQQ